MSGGAFDYVFASELLSNNCYSCAFKEFVRMLQYCQSHSDHNMNAIAQYLYNEFTTALYEEINKVDPFHDMWHKNNDLIKAIEWEASGDTDFKDVIKVWEKLTSVIRSNDG